MSESPGARCAILIPAHDEEARVAQVVAAACAARCGVVLVVDDGSRDGTSAAARAAGAEVLAMDANRGKGGALLAGATRLDAEVVVLVDADLIGLRPQHVRDLADPVLAGEADMTRGIFAGARWATTTAQRLAPQLGGQRALRRRDLLALRDLGASRYGVEILLAEAARRHGWTTRDVPLQGVSQVMKEEKLGWLQGIAARAGMYRDIVAAWWRART